MKTILCVMMLMFAMVGCATEQRIETEGVAVGALESLLGDGKSDEAGVLPGDPGGCFVRLSGGQWQRCCTDYGDPPVTTCAPLSDLKSDSACADGAETVIDFGDQVQGATNITCGCDGPYVCCNFYDADGNFERRSCGISARCTCIWRGCDWWKTGGCYC